MVILLKGIERRLKVANKMKREATEGSTNQIWWTNRIYALEFMVREIKDEIKCRGEK